jgi:hypothetical protein
VPRVLVIHREPQEAGALAGRLRDRGIDAQPYLSLGTRGFREIRGDPPEAILIDLTRLPSYGKAIGVLLRENKSLGGIPLVFLEGDPAKTAAIRRVLPDATYAAWAGVAAAIERALARPRAVQAPRLPSRSVAQKLGIEPGTTLALCNSPAGHRLELPEGVRTGAAEEAGVVMFWSRTEAALDRELPRLAKLLTKGRRLWLLWPKRTSGIETNLSMPRVRELANRYGLTDYKVCAVDNTWSAMAVGPRRR